MVKKRLIFFIVITLLCFIILIANSYQSITIDKFMFNNDFDINKVDNFHLSQSIYNWYSSEVITNEITDSQSMIYYLSQISKINLYKSKPFFLKTKYNFDYYNDVFLITLKLAYENKQFIVTIHNGEVSMCNLLINNNGIFEKHKLYIESFEKFKINF